MAISIIIADDHKLMRDGIRKLLETQKDFEVVAEAGHGGEAVDMARELKPSIVLMDISMPGMNGIEATEKITRSGKGSVRVVAISVYTDPLIVKEVIKAGASSFLPKSCAFDDLAGAIRCAAAGIEWDGGGNYSVPREAAAGSPPQHSAALSAREVEVLRLIARGRSTKQIASQLHISVKTAETHRKNIQDKLGIKSVAELTVYALSHGISDT
jgi:DNA-binding NarL/FixJ family response regulator